MNDSSKHEKYQQSLSGAIVKKCLQKNAEHLLNLFSVRSQEDQLNFKIYIYIREYLLDCNNLQYASDMIDEKIKECIENPTNNFTVKNFDEVAIRVLRLKYLYKSFEEIKNATKISEPNSNEVIFGINLATTNSLIPW